MRQSVLFLVLIFLFAACAPKTTAVAPTAEEAKIFIDNVNATSLRLGIENSQAAFVWSTYITADTANIRARANQAYIDAMARFATEAVRFDKVMVPPDVRRQLDLLKLSLTMATPSNPEQAEELTRLAVKLPDIYAKGEWRESATKSLNIDQITNVMAESFDEKRLRQVWEGWHTIAPPMRKDFERFIELSNLGARQMGFVDAGDMWRSKYDMTATDFSNEVESLWTQVQPLYRSLHAYVRMKLHEKYGDVVPVTGPIPAHLLGDIWAQDWSNLYPILKPDNAGKNYDLTAILKERKITPVQMVKMAERFYTSLGFNPLPETFWERSQFTRPQDRSVQCQAQASHVDKADDVRIRMCIQAREADFETIHHELGHIYYYLAYKAQPSLFRQSANDAFHEATGDTIALSLTPDYLVKIGLLDQASDASGDIGLLLARALDKVAFLPFGLMIDQWRWKVFSGEIAPADYNKTWWALRLKYQGIAPPSERGEQFFDPGAKFHVAANTPYTRYFLADILQYQFHRALSKTAACTTPLHRCSIFGSKDAGKKLNAMLTMGLSRPWPEALEALTDSKQMDATAMMDYFAPLKQWLDQQTRGKPVGW